MRIVATSTIHPPHARWGTKSNMSTRNASSVMRSVGIDNINRARRYLCEWEGECRCAVAERMKHIKVNKAATGCTIRIADKDDRVLVGKEKSELSSELPKSVFASAPYHSVSLALDLWLEMNQISCYSSGASSSTLRATIASLRLIEPVLDQNCADCTSRAVRTDSIPNVYLRALCGRTIAQNAEADAIEACNMNGLDYGSRDGCEN